MGGRLLRSGARQLGGEGLEFGARLGRRQVDDLFRAGRRRFDDLFAAGQRACSFSADTPVATPDGERPISEIAIGDAILGYNESSEAVGVFVVTAVHSQQHETTLDLTIGGEIVHTTDEHPFLVRDGDEVRWVEAQHLAVGASVLNAEGESGTVESVAVIDEPQVMVNLTVALAHSFVVGDGQWVVHNQGDSRIILELFSGPISQINRSVPGYRIGEAEIISFDIQTYGNPRIIQGDASNLVGISDNFADEVFITNMFDARLRKATTSQRHAFRDAVFTEVARVLRSGGIVHNSFAGNNPFAKITFNNRLIPEIRSLGFDLIRPTDPFIAKRGGASQVYNRLHPALRGASFGTPDEAGRQFFDFRESVMKTLSCRRR